MHAPISLDLGEWYALRLEPSREFVALLGLNQRNVHAYLPVMVCRRRVRGRLTLANQQEIAERGRHEPPLFVGKR
jgi:hypothetical protein